MNSAISWRVRQQLRTFAAAALLGAVVGVFILYPINEFVYFYEHRPLVESTPGGFALSQLQQSLRGGTPRKTAFYVIVGIVLSVAEQLLRIL